jgi:hypothetical protein
MRIALVLIVGALLAGCAARPGEGGPASATTGVTAASLDPSRSPGSDAQSDAGASLDPNASLDPAIAHAISQRRLFGLRSDLEWVVAVAADPTATVNLLDFPMTPAEERAFQDDQATYEEVAAAVNEYAASHADEFGGVWIEQERHTVVSAWTGNGEIHRLAILARLGHVAPLEALQVRYPEARLRALQDRIGQEMHWLATLPAQFSFSSVDIMHNRAEVGISSANPDAPRLILEHFGVPADMLRVESDGTGILLQPRGTIHVALAGAGVRFGPDLDWNVAWTSDRPQGGGDCGDMTGIGIPEDGTFDLDCAPGGWTIAIQERSGESDWVAIGSVHVVVPAAGAVDGPITVRPSGASPSP